LANDGGYVALKQAAEDREGWIHRERMSKSALKQKTTGDDSFPQPWPSYDWLFMPPPLIGGGIKRWCCLTSVWRPTSVCLTYIAYIGPKSRTERPRKTKIGTEVAHVILTRTPLSRSKGQRSRSPGRFTHRRVGASGSCSGGHGNVLAVGNCCYTLPSARWREVLRHPRREERDGRISWQPPAYSLLYSVRACF